MRKIAKIDIGEKLQKLLNEQDLHEEDIGIFEEENLLGVLITKEAYKFFLRKVEEEEDKIDNRTVQEFHKSGEKMNNF